MATQHPQRNTSAPGNASPPRSGTSAGVAPLSADARTRQALDDVLVVLEKERACTHALLEQAKQIQKHLLSDDYMSLLVAAQEQEIHAQQLAQWEHRRLLLTRQLAKTFPAVSRTRLSLWANVLPEPHATRLHTIQATLQRVTEQLQTVNRQNMALVQRSLRFAEMALGIDSSAYGVPHTRVNRDGLPQLFDKTL